eukprot:SAG11_NODE_15214_length_585_cov_0.839506_2_plen_44_part_01
MRGNVIFLLTYLFLQGEDSFNSSGRFFNHGGIERSSLADIVSGE